MEKLDISFFDCSENYDKCKPQEPKDNIQTLLRTTIRGHDHGLFVAIGTSGRRCSRSPLGGRLATTLVDRYFHHYFPPFRKTYFA